MGLRPRPPHRLPTRGLGLTDIHSSTTPCDASRTTILSWRSALLQGLTHSTRRAALTARHLSWGLVPLQRNRGAESTSLLSAGPIRPTTFRPQGSSPLDGLLLHPPCPRLPARASLVGFSLQGFPLSDRPGSSSLPGFPSWRSSLGLASLRLEQREPGAHMRCP